MAADSGERMRWGILIVLFTARTAFGFQFQALAVSAPLYTPPLDYVTVGVLMGLYMLPGAAVALPGGVLGQRFGEKRIALVGLALMTAGAVIVAATSAPSAIAAGRIVSGAGAVLLNVCLTTMLIDWFIGRELVLALGVLASSWSMGVGLSFLLLPPAAALGPGMALATPVAVCAAAFVLVAGFYRAPPNVAPRASFRLALDGREWSATLLSGIAWGLFNFAFASFLVFAPGVLERGGLTRAGAAAIASFANWAIILTLPFGGHVARWVGSSNGVMFGGLLLLAAIVAGFLAGLPGAVACVLFGLVSGPVAGLIMALPGPALRAENRAAGMGVFFAVYYACLAGLMPLAGWSGEASGTPAGALVVSAASLVAAIPALAVFRRRHRR